MKLFLIVFFFILLLFQNSSLLRAFRLFRALGLRHIVAVNENNEVSEWALK